MKANASENNLKALAENARAVMAATADVADARKRLGAALHTAASSSKNQ